MRYPNNPITMLATRFALIRIQSSRMKRLFVLLSLVGFGFFPARPAASAQPQWWKGNLHTHSFWSDGDDFPEMIVDWYKEHGYQFLALSDHNKMLVGEKWIDATTNRAGPIALENYRKRFGGNWVEVREENGHQQVRLKTLEEFRGRFEAPGKFLLIPGEEISDRFNKVPIHLNASNLREQIEPQ